MQTIIGEISKRFKVSKAILNDEIAFNGRDIEQSVTKKIKMCMSRYLVCHVQVELESERKNAKWVVILKQKHDHFGGWLVKPCGLISAPSPRPYG